MKKLIAAALFAPAIASADFYVDAGISLHPEKWGRPEFIASNPLGSVEIGYEWRKVKIYAEHTSSVPDWEYGYGVNKVIAFKIRLIGEYNAK